MSSLKSFQCQTGGLYTAIVPFDGADPIYQSAFASILEDTVRHEAKVHGANFDKTGFQNVLRALSRKNTGNELRGIEALFFVAAWDTSRPKIIGATINFRSLFMERQGQDIGVNYGIYSEDVCLLVSKIKELVAERPDGRWFPEGGIGYHFIKESMRHFAENGMNGSIYPVGQGFEFASDNTNIIKIQRQLGAQLGSDADSGLFRLNGLNPTMQNRFRVPVECAEVVLPNGMVDPNNFVVKWQSDNGRQKINTGFMNGLSTFTGIDVSQCNIVSNGQLPLQGVIQDVIASAFAVAEHKIRTNLLSSTSHTPLFSPSIPLEGTTKEMREAAFNMSNHEISSYAPQAANDDAEMTFNIHARNEPEIVDALKGMNVQSRVLGSRLMQTASLDLTGEMHEAGTLHKIQRPKLIVPDTSRPLFDFAA